MHKWLFFNTAPLLLSSAICRYASTPADEYRTTRFNVPDPSTWLDDATDETIKRPVKGDQPACRRPPLDNLLHLLFYRSSPTLTFNDSPSRPSCRRQARTRLRERFRDNAVETNQVATMVSGMLVNRQKPRGPVARHRAIFRTRGQVAAAEPPLRKSQVSAMWKAQEEASWPPATCAHHVVWRAHPPTHRNPCLSAAPCPRSRDAARTLTRVHPAISCRLSEYVQACAAATRCGLGFPGASCELHMRASDSRGLSILTKTLPAKRGERSAPMLNQARIWAHNMTSSRASAH